MNDNPPTGINDTVKWLIGIAILILLHTVSIVWWAATLSANMSNVKELVVQSIAKQDKLEERVRQLEQRMPRTP